MRVIFKRRGCGVRSNDSLMNNKSKKDTLRVCYLINMR